MSSYFQFLGHVIETSRVAALARMSAPVIEVNASDIVSPSWVEVAGLEYPLVVHHDNTYHLLANSKKQLVGDKIKVKMISKVLLKKITQPH